MESPESQMCRDVHSEKHQSNLITYCTAEFILSDNFSTDVINLRLISAIALADAYNHYFAYFSIFTYLIKDGTNK
jgi:hypothetical protein